MDDDLSQENRIRLIGRLFFQLGGRSYSLGMTSKYSFWVAIWVSIISTSVIIISELTFSGGFPVGIPWAVFGFLFATSFIAISSILEGVKRLKLNIFGGLGGILVGAFSLSAWLTLFLDQLPCFLGGQGC